MKLIILSFLILVTSCKSHNDLYKNSSRQQRGDVFSDIENEIKKNDDEIKKNELNIIINKEEFKALIETLRNYKEIRKVLKKRLKDETNTKQNDKMMF